MDFARYLPSMGWPARPLVCFLQLSESKQTRSEFAENPLVLNRPASTTRVLQKWALPPPCYSGGISCTTARTFTTSCLHTPSFFHLSCLLHTVCLQANFAGDAFHGSPGCFIQINASRQARSDTGLRSGPLGLSDFGKRCSSCAHSLSLSGRHRGRGIGALRARKSVAGRLGSTRSVRGEASRSTQRRMPGSASDFGGGVCSTSAPFAARAEAERMFTFCLAQTRVPPGRGRRARKYEPPPQSQQRSPATPGGRPLPVRASSTPWQSRSRPSRCAGSLRGVRRLPPA